MTTIKYHRENKEHYNYNVQCGKVHVSLTSSTQGEQLYENYTHFELFTYRLIMQRKSNGLESSLWTVACRVCGFVHG